MSSRSATVLVIFVVACIAFCLASVFGAMTGQISILPNESDSESVLDNLSAITDSDDNYESYGSEDTYDYSNDYSSQDSSSSKDQVETTTAEDTQQSSQSQDSGSQVETTTDSSKGSSQSSSQSQDSSSQVEITTG